MKNISLIIFIVLLIVSYSSTSLYGVENADPTIKHPSPVIKKQKEIVDEKKNITSRLSSMQDKLGNLFVQIENIQEELSNYQNKNKDKNSKSNKPDLFSIAIAIITVIIGAYVAYVLGLRTYFRQKEYEMVRKRYLEEGIDLIAQEVDRALSIFMYNWNRGLTVIKHFRDVGTKIDPLLYNSGFEHLNISGIFVRPHYKLKLLVNDDVFHKVQQFVHSFVESANKFIIEDLCNTVKLRVDGEKSEVSDKEIVDIYIQKLIKSQEDSQLYYILIQQLESVAGELETQQLSYEQLKLLYRINSVYPDRSWLLR